MAALLVAALLALGASAWADPEVRRVDEEGLQALLQSHRGRVVLLNVWATWCEPCREEFPALVRFQKDYRDRGAEVVFISVDDPDQVQNLVAPFLKAQGVTSPAYVKDAKRDEAFIDRLDSAWSGAIPATFLYDREGRRAGTLVGAQTYEGLVQQVAPLIGTAEAQGAEEEVADPETLFRWSAQVSPEAVTPGGRTEARLVLSLAKDHLVYRERTSVTFEASAGVQVGEVVFPASHQKHDPVTGEAVEAFTGAPTFTFTAPVTVAPDAKAGPVKLTATVRYQGCSPKLCYLPATKTLDATFRIEGEALTSPLPQAGEGGASGASRGEGRSSLQDFSAGGGLLAKGRLWALLLTFFGGVLTSLTPCVYPLIPITIGIFGARGARRLIERLALSVIYVLGIAAMYSGLGLAAASTGAVFGQVMANPWVIGGVAAIFAAFGASMLGAFEMQLPPALQSRLTQVGGKGYGGAFALGLVGGIIAAPCTGPALGAVLTYVATTRDLMFGFWLLLTFALGLGVLFIVIGTFSGAVSALPRSGGWMEGVKSVLGIVMLAGALFYLKDVVPSLREALGRSTGYFAGAGGAVILGLLLGAVHRSFHDASTGVRLRKGLGVALCVAGLYAVAGAFTVASAEGPAWVQDEAEGLAQARREGRPAMIDFYADWCAACVELDRHTYSDPKVRERLRAFVSIKLDFTKDSEATQALQKKYRLVGLPTVLFFDGQGNELPQKRLTGFVPPEKFLAHIEDIR